MIGFSRKVELFFSGLFRRRFALPRQLQVELTNRCNLRCKMCQRSLLKVPEVDMPRDVFDALVGNLRGVKDIVLRGWGEPLMHPNFLEFVDRIGRDAPWVNIQITTNGHLLRGDILEGIIDSGLSRVAVSIDRLRGGEGSGHANPEKVAANIEELIRRRGASSLPQLVLQPTMQRGGLNDVLDLIRFAKDVGADMVNLLRMDAWLPEGVQRPSREEESDIVRRAVKEAGGKVNVFFLNQKSLPVRIASHNDRLCLRTLFHAYIDVYGNVSPCCLLRDQVMGNIQKHSLREIWNTRSFQRFFKTQADYCSKCDAFFSIYHE